MPEIGGERAGVQNPLIKYATEIGWDCVTQKDALERRGGKTGLLFKDLFKAQILKLNPDFMNEPLAEELIKRLEHIPANVEGNQIAWEHLVGLKSIFVPDEKRERNVKFIDTQDIDKNTFHVTDEYKFHNGKDTIIPDVVFLINGVPVFIIETKAAQKIDGMSEALEQIKRYHRECPELLSVLQIYTLTHIISYYYSATWNTSSKWLFNWKEETQGDFETLVKAFFDRERVIKVLSDFIIFTRQDDELKKVVLRPHQMRAVDKIVERAALKEKKRGLVWHTQGSGKTYTMIVAAKKILENPLFENPTVIMLVDRNELESQLFDNIKSVGFENVEVADSKRHLKELLEGGRRGLIVTMIHKFENMPANINTKENVFVLVDEAHRTTGGDLGIFLMGALPEATYIGFTGTPIDKTFYGKGTFKTFGVDDSPKGYLDKYSIAESIKDGTTVSLHYTLAPNELLVDKEVLEKEFLDLAEAQEVRDIESLNKVLERAVNLRNMLKNKDRVERIGEYVANHFKEYIEPMGYKAFLVGVDREACAMYKEELDKYLPPEYSRVVYSPGHNDTPELSKYHLSKDNELKIRKAFKKPDEPPNILIVTEKLLTGFDAPILYCMYLDKPMRDHVLLQAIARVNRPYEDNEGRKKPSGFVFDFVGIFDNLEKALAFDSHDIEGVVHDIEVLKGRFTELIKEAAENYLSLIKGKRQDKAIEAVLEHFIDEEKRHEYYKFFKEISDIYEILSPDAFLRPFIDKYETLVRVFRILKEAYEPKIPVDKEFTRKTAKLVQEHTKSGEIKASLDIYEINEDTLEKLDKSDTSDTERVFNLIRSVIKEVDSKRRENPYLISIGEKAELISQMYKERQKTTQETLDELRNLVEDINEAQKEQAEKNLPTEIFSIFWVLKNEAIENPEDKANQMCGIMEQYPHWKSSEEHERMIKQELYKVLFQGGLDADATTEVAKKIMRVLTGGS